MTKKKTIKKVEKTVSIVMPVGVDAGKEVEVTEKRATEIEAIFGTYKEGGVAGTLIYDPGYEAGLHARVAELEARALEATAALDLLFDEVTGAAPKDGVSLVDKITELTELLSSEPDAQDAVKEEGGDNG